MEPTANQDAMATPEPPAPTNKKGNSGLKIATIVCAILAVAGLGFGVYELLQANSAKQQISDLKIEITKEDGTVTTLETDVIETTEKNGTTIKVSDSSSIAIANNYIERDLRNKTIRLNGGYEGFYDDKFFEASVNYIPYSELYANSLTDAQKTYLYLETAGRSNQGYYQWDSDINADLSDRLAEYGDVSGYIANYIPANRAKIEFYDLFGSEITKECSSDCKYGEHKNAYYKHIIGGRGGAWGMSIVGRISSIVTNGDTAYVDFNAGMIYTDPSKQEIINKVVGPGDNIKDELNIDNVYDSTIITDENYSKFQSYRFVFRKNSKGFYSFERVEEV